MTGLIWKRKLSVISVLLFASTILVGSPPALYGGETDNQPIYGSEESPMEEIKDKAILMRELKKGNFFVVTEEKDGYLRVKKEYRTPEVKDALYQILVTQEDELLSRGEGLYYIYLLRLMGDVRETRAIPYLLEDLGDRGTAMSFGRMGEPALKIIVKKLEKRNKEGKKHIPDAYIVPLHEMLKEQDGRSIIRAKSRAKIKDILLRAVKDEHRITRRNAISGLGEMVIQGDTDVLPIIKTIATNDPYISGGKRYIVRETAQKVLRKVKDHQLRKKNEGRLYLKKSTTGQ